MTPKVVSGSRVDLAPIHDTTTLKRGDIVLAPGGLHLMLADPRSEPAAGDALVIEFALRDGGTLRGEFEIR